MRVRARDKAVLFFSIIGLLLYLATNANDFFRTASPRYYYLINSYFNNNVYLLDVERQPIKHWTLEAGCPSSTESYSRTDGHLQLVTPAKNGGFFAIFKHQELTHYDWNGVLRWKLCTPAHHEILEYNKTLLTLSLLEVTGTYKGDSFPILVDELLEIDSNSGAVRNRHNLYNALLDFGVGVSLKKARNKFRDKEKRYEIIHSNAIARFTKPISGLVDAGDLLVSAKHLDSLFIYNLRTKKISWYWGKDTLKGQHSPVILPDNNLLIFDNSTKKKGSRILLVDIARKKILSSYPETEADYFYNPTMGNTQLLGDGSVLVGMGHAGRAFAINKQGTKNWEWENYLHPEAGKPPKKPMPFYRLVQYRDREYSDLFNLPRTQADG